MGPTTGATLAASGRSPEAAEKIIGGAIAEGRARVASGAEVRSLVAYALAALPERAWGEKFLAPEPEAPEGSLEEQQAVAELAEALEVGPREAQIEISKMEPGLARSGALVGVRAALAMARRRSQSGLVPAPGGLIRFFLRRAPRELAPEVRRQMRRASESDPQAVAVVGWETVRQPLASDPKARLAFEVWQRLRASAPSPDSPGYLEHFDAERQGHRALLVLAEAALGPKGDGMQRELTSRLLESGIQEGTLVWRRAWEHHWGRLVGEAWGIPCESNFSPWRLGSR